MEEMPRSANKGKDVFPLKKARTRSAVFFIAAGLLAVLTGCLTTVSGGTNEYPASGPSLSVASSSYHYMLGVLYIRDGNLDQAINEFKKALWLDPDSSYLTAEIASAYLGAGNSDEALRICREYLGRHPDNLELILLAADIYRQTRNVPRAIEGYKRAIELEPANIPALFNLGILYGETNRIENAVDTFHKIMGIKPDHLLAAYYLARGYLRLGSRTEAEHWLKITLEIRPHFEAALLELAYLYENTGRSKDAVEVYLAYLSFYPDVVKVRLRLADIYRRGKLAQSEEEELLKAKAIDGNDREVQLALGIFYFDQGRYRETYEIFEGYLKAHPQDDRARYLFAASSRELKKDQQALLEYGKIPAGSNLFANARIQMGIIMEKSGRLDEGIRAVEEALAHKQTDGLYAFLSSLYDKRKDYEKAEKILLTGLERFPKNIDLHYSLGMLYEKTDRFDLGLRQMEIILKEDPDNAEALNFIGYCYADRGIRLEEAEELIKRALKLKPGSGHIIDSLGWVYFRQGKLDLAIRYLEEAARALPDDPIVAEHLGDAYARQGLVKEAVEVYGRALNLSPDNEGLKRKISSLKDRF